MRIPEETLRKTGLGSLEKHQKNIFVVWNRSIEVSLVSFRQVDEERALTGFQ